MATSFPVGIYPPFNTRSTRSFPTSNNNNLLNKRKINMFFFYF